MNQCDICEEIGSKECHYCSLGNPCLGCDDYDLEHDKCTSNGACGDADKENKE